MPTARREILTIILLLLSATAVYWPPPPQEGSLILGGDYFQLHVRRMQFAREAIFGPGHSLPAWYSRELLGTPFRANLQNFPFIPTRLLITLVLEPAARWTYPLAVMLSAALAALFTFLFLRRIHLGLLASFVGGWTFACGGFFASRVAAGHLPLLEAYLSLPLLLWTIETFVQTSQGRWIVAIGISTACVALSGHPQLPIYSLAVASGYTMWRGGIRRGGRAWLAMILGVGCAAFALLPMLILIGKSTRILPLAPAENDVSLPYRMLPNFFLPWRNGYAPPMSQAGTKLFRGYPNWAYFWDTFCYAGIAPWIALAGILFTKSRRIALPWIALGLIGIVLALPFSATIISTITGGATLLRAPARSLYLTEFALAVLLAMFVQRCARSVKAEGAKFLLAGFLVCHAIDLIAHDRPFIQNQLGAAPSEDESAAAQFAADSVGDGRAAFDYIIPAGANRSVDDVGVFDSLLLAAPYQFLLNVADAQTDLNVQYLDGWQLSRRALQAAGVNVVVAMQDRPDLERLAHVGRLFVFRVHPTESRAKFFSGDEVRHADRAEIIRALRDESSDLAHTLLLPAEVPASHGHGEGTVVYRRPSSDQVECDVRAESAGFLRIIEAFDPGWSATIDGKPVQVIRAWDALLCVAIPEGSHRVAWEYHTPGAAIGSIISIGSLGLLIALMARGRSASA